MLKVKFDLFPCPNFHSLLFIHFLLFLIFFATNVSTTVTSLNSFHLKHSYRASKTCKVKPLYLFGGKAGWTDEDFNAVDDRVRGGNSTSFLQVTENNTARFYGFLDTTTLGGAGFASQRTTFTSHTWDLCLYTGLTITTRKSDGKTYALNLYTSDRTTRPDGRLESGVEYKYLFTAPADDEEHTFYAKWDEFIPYYRGRPDQKGKKINPGNIKAFSLMLASLFGKQKGDFSIEFVSIVAIRKGSGRKIGRECCGGKGTEKWCVIL